MACGSFVILEAAWMRSIARTPAPFRLNTIRDSSRAGDLSLGGSRATEASCICSSWMAMQENSAKSPCRLSSSPFILLFLSSCSFL